MQFRPNWASGASPPSRSVGAIYCPYVVVSMPMRYMCAFLFRRTISSLRIYGPTNTVGEERESVVPANLCIVVGCATKRARGYRDRRGKGGQLDVVCGTGLYSPSDVDNCISPGCTLHCDTLDLYADHLVSTLLTCALDSFPTRSVSSSRRLVGVESVS